MDAGGGRSGKDLGNRGKAEVRKRGDEMGAIGFEVLIRSGALNGA